MKGRHEAILVLSRYLSLRVYLSYMEIQEDFPKLEVLFVKKEDGKNGNIKR